MKDHPAELAELVGRGDLIEITPFRSAVRRKYLDRITHQASDQLYAHALKHEKGKHVLRDRCQNALREFLTRNGNDAERRISAAREFKVTPSASNTSSLEYGTGDAGVGLESECRGDAGSHREMRRPVQAQPGDVQKQDLLIESADRLVVTQHRFAQRRRPDASAQNEQRYSENLPGPGALGPPTTCEVRSASVGRDAVSEIRPRNGLGRK